MKFSADTFVVDDIKIPKNIVFNDVNLVYVLGSLGLPLMKNGQRTFELRKDVGSRKVASLDF